MGPWKHACCELHGKLNYFLVEMIGGDSFFSGSSAYTVIDKRVKGSKDTEDDWGNDGM